MEQFSLYISKRIAIAGVGDPHLRFRHRFGSNLAGAIQSKAVVVCVFNQVTLILLAILPLMAIADRSFSL